MNSVPPAFWIVTAAILGAIFGSYINMAAHRLPRGISTWRRSRSFCPKCNHGLAWYDNIPILSYLSLLGKCRYCRVPIPPRYLVTELIVAALFALATYQFVSLNGGPPGPMPTAMFAVTLFLIVDFTLLSVVDFEVYLIPIETTLWWIPVALIVGMIFPEIHFSMSIWTRLMWFNALIDGLTGLVVGAALLWTVGFLVAIIFFLRNTLRGIKEPPPEAMGMGDVHLLALYGALFGWKAALMTILLGVLIGAVTGVAKILFDKLQRWRLGGAWKPTPPTFDLPDDGIPYEPQLWMPPTFGGIVLIGALLLDDQRAKLVAGNSYNHIVPVTLLMIFGSLLVLAFPFFLMLKKKGLMPGGEIRENEDGEKKEVYHGNYIPFGPSLALAGLLVALWDPVLREFAFKFFLDPKYRIAPPYHVIGESWLIPALTAILDAFVAFSRWLLHLMGGPA